VIFFVAQIHHFAHKKNKKKRSPGTDQGNFLEIFKKIDEKSIEVIKIFAGFGQIFSFLF
jgi:hypothetical protein